MPNVLRIAVRFLDPEPAFHGKRDGGEPEWPPSPLRLFQALVDAAANRWRGSLFDDCAKPELERLQAVAPEIVAPSQLLGRAYQLAVPDNDLDVWVGPLSRGEVPKKQPSNFLSLKHVRPTRIRGDALRGDALQYLYPMPDLSDDKRQEFVNVIGAAARSVTHLGWGIDMVAADANVVSDEEAAKLPGHRWRAVLSGGVPLRVPKAGSLANLMEKHQAFLGRLSNDGFKPVPPLSCFDIVQYYSPTANGSSMPARPYIAFEIHRTIEDQELPQYAGKSRYRPYHHVRGVAAVAGMVRHATAAVAKTIGWEEADVACRIQGHGDEKDGQATSDDRFMFLPLPSITPVGVSGIRRVLLVAPTGFDLAPLRRHLNGQELIDLDTKKPVAMLSGLAANDKFLRRNYTGVSTTWSTVTPVILPGYDDPGGLRAKYKERIRLKEQVNANDQKKLLDRIDSRILALIWKAFHQAGWTADALEGTSIEYRAVGWFRGLDLARNYDLHPLKYPRYHLRVRFPHPIRGPLAIGAGRYRGLGLFAAEDS